MSALELSRSDRWQRWLCAAGPSPLTARGVAWRLTAIWPSIIALRMWLPAALTFATCMFARISEWEAYRGWVGFAPLALMPVVPIIYAHIFEMQSVATFTVASGRALAVLPVPAVRLRDAAWLADVLLPVLRSFFPSLLVLAVLPLPFWFKHWYAAALFALLTVLGGMRAGGQLGQLRAKLPAQLGAARLAGLLDTLFLFGSFLSMFVLLLRNSQASTTYGTAIFCAATMLWSYARMPLLGTGRDSSGVVAASKAAKRHFAPASREFARIYLPAAAAPLMMMALLYVMGLFMGSRMLSQFPIMVLIGCQGLGVNLAMRARPVRLLPASTRQLTRAALLYGVAAAVPVALLVWGISTAGQPATLALLYTSAAGLWMTALVLASMWMLVYQAAFIFVLMAFTFAGVFLAGGIVKLGALELAIIANVLGAIIFGLAWTSIHRGFLWHSKVYRSVFQNRQQMQVSYTTDWGEKLALLIYGAICVGATGLGLFALLST